MPSFRVETPQRSYDAIVERGALARVGEFIPPRSGKTFIVTTADVWHLHGAALGHLGPHTVLNFPGGEPAKRLTQVEALAEQMVEAGADRSSVIIAFGGGIVGDVAGFLAAIFMRGIPVIQVPTTLLAQVDAAVGGKTGVNLVSGKNLLGSFHQPLAVLIDPDVLRTLPEREYRAGLYEIVKCGVIRDAELFELLDQCAPAVLSLEPATVERIIAGAVGIKAEVVTADEREGDLRRILNFGHTFGHALEAETRYERFLHEKPSRSACLPRHHSPRTPETYPPRTPPRSGESSPSTDRSRPPMESIPRAWPLASVATRRRFKVRFTLSCL